MLIWQSQKDKKIFMNEATSKKTGRRLGASERDAVRFSVFAPQNVKILLLIIKKWGQKQPEASKTTELFLSHDL